MNRRVMESLIRAGALDCLYPHRASLLATLEPALRMAEQQAESQAQGQADLFGNDSLLTPDAVRYVMCLLKILVITNDCSRTINISLNLSGHPLQRYESELSQLITAKIIDLKPSRNQSVMVAGLIVGLRAMFTKRGDRMAFVTLDDCTSRIEMAVFSDVYEANKKFISERCDCGSLKVR